MRRRRGVWRLALAVALGAVAGTSGEGVAAAHPTIWSQARDPQAARLPETLDSVDSLLYQARGARKAGAASAAVRQLLLREARERLEAIPGRLQQEPGVSWRRARVELELYDVDASPAHLERAASALRHTVAAPLPTPMAAEAWNDLAVTYARLGMHAEEIAAYDRALTLEPHPEDRGVLLANQAEGLMSVGRIREAVAGYRAAIATTPGYALHYYGVTTWWGLAVALDRSGDLAASLQQIALARAYDPEDRRLSSDSWFYVPDYDRYWYAALGRWYDGRQGTDRRQRLLAYEQAVRAWQAYLEHAPASDRWRTIAVGRLQRCERERRALLSESDDR